jgi:hypothetical protein
MNPILRNILGVLAGVIVGSTINMSLVTLGHAVVPLPEGVDVSNMEALKAAMPSFGPQHFVFPWLAHALGALSGAWLAAFIATTKKKWFAYGIAGWFMIGGIANVFLLGGPMWFNVVDIAFAYIPMGWIATKLLKAEQ